ncbi:hypothetical protein C1646_687733 [Rhizophagus diaphanus]|nr:hypothetical protein C1646_687733 [Rhizophagus diaphanus] [Rhizophagus sp. MUCL 43196]
MKFYIIIYLLFNILFSKSFGQDQTESQDSTLTPPSPTSSNDSESPLLANKHPVLAHPLSKPTIVILVFLVLIILFLVSCVYITKYKQHWFTRFSPIPTHPKNVDQHNLPITEKSGRVLEENNNKTNTSFENNFLDDTPMMTKNSFSSTQLHTRSSTDENTSLVSNQPSTTSLPQSIDTVK